MSIKVKEEERKLMQEDYVILREKGYTKSAARQVLSNKYDRGLTTIWDNTHMMDHPSKESITSTPEISWPKTYILTSWEIRVKPDIKFINCLKEMAKLYDAELVLVPLNRSDVRYIPQVLKDNFHIVTQDIRFNQNLLLRFIESNALIQSPLSGHTGAYPDDTCIIPGLVKELRTEPSQNYVKQLMSTGSVGRLVANISDYPEVSEDDEKELHRKWKLVQTRMYGKPTAIAENYIVPSALVVEVLDEKLFLTRFVSSLRSGVVYDLNKKFTPDGFEESRPLALFVGDTHAIEADKDVIVATKEMISSMNPKEVILNDFFDGRSVNHHEISDPAKFNDAPSLEEEADITKALLTEFADISDKVIYLNSNHCNFLTTYLSGPQHQWRLNGNYQKACELQLYRLETKKHPIIKLLDLDKFKNVKFIDEKDRHYCGKVLVKHGHEGINGARVGFNTSAKVFNYYCQGHLHSPAVYRNAAMAGLTSNLVQGYNNECGSNWLHANVLIQNDSSMQLLPVIHGIWRP